MAPPPIWPFTLVFGTWTLLLVGTSALLLYPTVRYPRVVFHRDGVRELAASVLLLTAGAVVEGAFWSGLTASPWALVASRALLAACGVTLAAAAWNFARPFLGAVGEDGAEAAFVDGEGDDG